MPRPHADTGTVAALAAALLATRAAAAQSPAAPPAPTVAAPITTVAEGASRTATRATVTVAGYVEAFYAFNFNLPHNDVTHFRGFDNRHNTVTLANGVVDLSWALSRVSGRLALQAGHTPETYYLAEPSRPGAAAAGDSDADVWRFFQQANVAWDAPVGRGILIEGGLFLSPIGPEGFAIKDQWNWSRSNLFFGLPFYHTGLRATYDPTDRLALTLAVYNGWNSVTDNNDEKSVSLQVTYNVADRVTASALYFGGVERPPGATEGRAWRHLVDAYVAWYATPALSLMAQVNAGVEPNDLGTAGWFAAAGYVRLRPARWLYVAARGDFFYETAPAGGASVFWPLHAPGGGAPHQWVSSQTLTLDARPHDNVSIRLEYRHDQADAAMYFARTPSLAPSGAARPTATAQDTLTLGMVTWF